MIMASEPSKQSTSTPWLNPDKGRLFSIYCITAAFLTYFSMYAFRKPFSAGYYEGLSLWGIDYKILLVIIQVMGYATSKFIGIKVIAELTPRIRVRLILTLIGLSWVALFLFGITPYPYNFIWLFFNGLPLGMIWGIVFSFLEGRRNTELLGAGLSASFIVASGFVKSVGRWWVDIGGVSEFWMPFLTGLVFIPPLLLSTWLLSKIPEPDEKDIAMRTKRVPMNVRQRWAFFMNYATGIVFLVLLFVFLTGYRDFRDNFAIELWRALGYADQPEILTISEIPIAFGVVILVGLMMYIRSNEWAFGINLGIITISGLLLIGTTWMFEQQLLDPAMWMILVGFSMYLAYISYHTMLFERWIATFKSLANVGFLMYIADAFGYLGSVGIMLYKNFGAGELSWLSFFVNMSYGVGISCTVCALIASAYFWRKYQKFKTTPQATVATSFK